MPEDAPAIGEQRDADLMPKALRAVDGVRFVHVREQHGELLAAVAAAESLGLRYLIGIIRCA